MVGEWNDCVKHESSNFQLSPEAVISRRLPFDNFGKLVSQLFVAIFCMFNGASFYFCCIIVDVIQEKIEVRFV